MKTDLHIHTYYSDGKFSPDEIASFAKEAGVGLLSMTDHDSMEGLDKKRAAAAREGLQYIPGWEVSSYDAIGKVHILGYGCSENDAYRSFLEERKRGAFIRIEDTLKKANAYFGLHLTLDDVEREHTVKEAPLHTMHAVRAYARILNAGKNALKMKIGQIYFNFFAPGKPAYSDLCRPLPVDALNVIHAAGGIACLAHPGRIPNCPEREQLMNELCRAGLDGLECFYTTHTREETEYFCAFARQNGLYQTGGSDFHDFGGRAVLGQPVFYPDEKLLSVLL